MMISSAEVVEPSPKREARVGPGGLHGGRCLPIARDGIGISDGVGLRNHLVRVGDRSDNGPGLTGLEDVDDLVGEGYGLG